MLIYQFTVLFYVLSRLFFLIPFLLFIISGDCPKFVYGFCQSLSTCSYYTNREFNLIFVLIYPSLLHFGNLTMETINKYSLYSRQAKIVFEFLNILVMFKLAQSYCYISCMCLWLCLSLDNYLGILLKDLPQGRMVIVVQEDMGRYLSRLSPLMVLEFTPEQMQNPQKKTECFKKVWPGPGNARELQFAALC